MAGMRPDLRSLYAARVPVPVRGSALSVTMAAMIHLTGSATLARGLTPRYPRRPRHKRKESSSTGKLPRDFGVKQREIMAAAPRRDKGAAENPLRPYSANSPRLAGG